MYLDRRSPQAERAQQRPQEPPRAAGTKNPAGSAATGAFTHMQSFDPPPPFPLLPLV